MIDGLIEGRRLTVADALCSASPSEARRSPLYCQSEEGSNGEALGTDR